MGEEEVSRPTESYLSGAIISVAGPSPLRGFGWPLAMDTVDTVLTCALWALAGFKVAKAQVYLLVYYLLRDRRLD
jgi:hypothetical protein